MKLVFLSLALGVALATNSAGSCNCINGVCTGCKREAVEEVAVEKDPCRWEVPADIDKPQKKYCRNKDGEEYLEEVVAGICRWECPDSTREPCTRICRRRPGEEYIVKKDSDEKSDNYRFECPPWDDPDASKKSCHRVYIAQGGEQYISYDMEIGKREVEKCVCHRYPCPCERGRSDRARRITLH